MIDYVRGLFDQFDPEVATILTRVVFAVSAILLAILADYVAKHIMLKTVTSLAGRSRTSWDDALVRRRFFHRLAHIAPALVFFWMARLIFFGDDVEGAAPWLAQALSVMLKAAELYMVLVLILTLDGFLSAFEDIYRTYEISKRIHIRSFVQVAKVLVVAVGIIITLSLLLDKNPSVFLTGMGAMTAVLLLVFRDAILGFVAGIQLTANNMVQVGDWIAMPAHDADGDVIDVSLTTVKVQNWDKTITTIPSYALVSESFKNWRGMSESGGRRIKRSISLDMNSVDFCTPEMIEGFKKIQCLRDYIEKRKQEIADYNKENEIDDSELVNGRRMTNLGTFRAYVVEYLKSHPQIHQDMTFLVRQLAPNEHGLPIEIYVFSKDQRWAYYEGIQADIFDHMIAAIPHFGLRVFQSPSGADLERGLEALGDKK